MDIPLASTYCCYDMNAQVFLQDPDFNSLGFTPISEIMG